MSLPIVNNSNNDSAVEFREEDFENQYFSLRQKEQRVYTDEQVASLPEIAADHLHYSEWQIRKKSSQKLIRYLEGKRRALKILEIGCGNGWLSSKLSNIKKSEVTGLDINRTELEQAARVFHHNQGLSFVYGDIRSGILNNTFFDIIVFAASIQYFYSLNEILTAALNHLKHGGEIHITDTRFYKREELDNARQRTKAYFTLMGFPGMLNSYFHHCADELRHFNTKIFYNPYSWRAKIFRNHHPFYWIGVRKHN